MTLLVLHPYQGQGIYSTKCHIECYPSAKEATGDQGLPFTRGFVMFSFWWIEQAAEWTPGMSEIWDTLTFTQHHCNVFIWCHTAFATFFKTHLWKIRFDISVKRYSCITNHGQQFRVKITWETFQLIWQNIKFPKQYRDYVYGKC